MNKIFKVLFIFLIIGKICWSQSTNFNVDLFQYISPVPGSGLHNPQTNIIIRQGETLNPFNLNDDKVITVTGDSSGTHSGTIYLTPDSKTIIFQPDIVFIPGELVSVSLRSGLTTTAGGNVDSLHFTFSVSKGFGGETNSANNSISRDIINFKNETSQNFSSTGSDPSLLSLNDFPTISIKNKNNPENGYYFFSLNKLNNNFLTIINNNGVPIFIKKFSERAYDFTLQKNGMLTYWDDTHLKFYGLDSLYQVVDSFYCGNGYYTDWHELQVMPNGNSFVLSYDTKPVNMDTVVADGVDTAHVTGCVIQEMDTEKRVLWQWRSWDHLNITDADASIVDLKQHSVQYCHINSIEVVDEDNIIFSIRNFNEIAGIEQKTGKIKWRFGGKKNQFTNNDTKALILQHDARFIGNNKISVYDNGDMNRKDSRAVIYQLDTAAFTTVLVKEIHRTPSLWARVMGNFQNTKNGNFIVGWGNSGSNTFFTNEYDSSGNLTNDLTFTSTSFIYSYRSFKFPWRTRVFTSESDTIIFPNTSIGNQSVKSIKIFNNTSASREITGFYNNAGEFTITNNFPLIIPPNSNFSLNFKFSATDSQEKTDTLYLVSKSTNEMIALPIILIGNPVVTTVGNVNLKLPIDFRLEQNYPNPFNPTTNINYSIPVESFVKIKIYNLLGEEIDELVNGLINSGNHSVKWKANGLASGIYFYEMIVIDITGKRRYQLAKKMLLIK